MNKYSPRMVVNAGSTHAPIETDERHLSAHEGCEMQMTTNSECKFPHYAMHNYACTHAFALLPTAAR